MTNQLPYEGPLDDDATDDHATGDDARDDGVEGLTGLDDDDRPLDPDLDDDLLDSAEADERAATEGTLDDDDLA
jgi:hypothetical protein